MIWVPKAKCYFVFHAFFFFKVKFTTPKIPQNIVLFLQFLWTDSLTNTPGEPIWSGLPFLPFRGTIVLVQDSCDQCVLTKLRTLGLKPYIITEKFVQFYNLAPYSRQKTHAHHHHVTPPSHARGAASPDTRGELLTTSVVTSARRDVERRYRPSLSHG